MQMHKKGYRNIRISNNTLILFIEKYYNEHKISS